MRVTWLAIVGCAGPAAKPIENVAPPVHAEAALAFDPDHCDDDTAPRHPINATETVSIVTCWQPAADGENELTASFVRRTAPARGTSVSLESWTQHAESGQSYDIAGVVNDRVLVRMRKGGLDQIPESTVTIYVIARDRFAKERYHGVDVEVRGATIRTCELARGGMYVQGKPCDQQTGAIVQTFAVGR